MRVGIVWILTATALTAFGIAAPGCGEPSEERTDDNGAKAGSGTISFLLDGRKYSFEDTFAGYRQLEGTTGIVGDENPIRVVIEFEEKTTGTFEAGPEHNALMQFTDTDAIENYSTIPKESDVHGDFTIVVTSYGGPGGRVTGSFSGKMATCLITLNPISMSITEGEFDVPLTD